MTILEQNYIFKMIIQKVRTSHSSFWCHFTETKKWFINSFTSKSPRQPFSSNPSSFVKTVRFSSISNGSSFLPFTDSFSSINFSIPTNKKHLQWNNYIFISWYYILLVNICLDKFVFLLRIGQLCQMKIKESVSWDCADFTFLYFWEKEFGKEF